MKKVISSPSRSGRLSPAAGRFGFTLVELLVVIGIIALLISILLPSLNKARQQASLVSCMSGLRQMGNALQMYMTDSKGQVPPGMGWIEPVKAPGFGNDWARDLSRYLGQRVTDPTRGNRYLYSSVFRCRDGLQPPNTTPVLQYTANARLFANLQYGTQTGYTFSPWNPQSFTAPVKLATIRGIASTAIIWDSPVDPATANAPAINNYLDNYAFVSTWQDYMSLNGPKNQGNVPTWPGNFGVTSPSALVKYNKDAVNGDNDPSKFGFRYRHLNNTTCAFLYGDGHCETRKLGILMQSEFFPRIDLKNYN